MSELFLSLAVGIILWELCREYKKQWDDVAKLILITSITVLVTAGDVIQEVIPVNQIEILMVVMSMQIIFRFYL